MSPTPEQIKAGATALEDGASLDTWKVITGKEAEDVALAVLTAAEVAPLVQSGQLRYREDIVDGLENAPTAFLRLFRGENFGKLVVRVG